MRGLSLKFDFFRDFLLWVSVKQRLKLFEQSFIKYFSVNFDGSNLLNSQSFELDLCSGGRNVFQGKRFQCLPIKNFTYSTN